jgi:hypothetical protein
MKRATVSLRHSDSGRDSGGRWEYLEKEITVKNGVELGGIES